jgi:ATP-dependent RNA helicase RhlE
MIAMPTPAGYTAACPFLSQGVLPMSFASLGLIEPIVRTLDALAYHTPTAVQEQAIPAILAGNDVMAAAQTGTGKTAGFTLPILQRLVMGGKVGNNAARALILVPTRELAEQVHESVRTYAEGLPLRSMVAYGGVSINPQMMTLRKGVDVLVATPGRLLDLHRQNAVHFNEVKTLVLDEADRMLDLGFARELDNILKLLPKKRQTLLFSATFSDPIRALSNQMLREPVRIEATPRNTTVAAIRQWVIPVDKKRKAALFVHLLEQRDWTQVLAFARTRKGVDELVGLLEAKGIPVDSIHGDKPQPARLRALDRFKAGEVRVLIATDVAARGIDIDDLPAVINVDLPIVAEDYVHRTGRTGRKGASGEAVSLVCADEVEQLAAIEVLTRQTLERVEEPGYAPEHRVPETDAKGQIVKKPKKPKKPKGNAPVVSEDVRFRR